MKSRIDHRDTTLANAHSIAVARVGIAFAPKDTPLQYFLPFLLEEESENEDSSKASGKNKISKQTAEIFVYGVKSRIIPNKCISALGGYIDEIYSLIDK